MRRRKYGEEIDSTAGIIRPIPKDVLPPNLFTKYPTMMDNPMPYEGTPNTSPFVTESQLNSAALKSKSYKFDIHHHHNHVFVQLMSFFYFFTFVTVLFPFVIILSFVISTIAMFIFIRKQKTLK